MRMRALCARWQINAADQDANLDRQLRSGAPKRLRFCGQDQARSVFLSDCHLQAVQIRRKRDLARKARCFIAVIA